MQQNDTVTNEGIVLSVITPLGVAYVCQCDSVTLPLFDGGSIGIRHGHIPAEMALMQGKVHAKANGTPLGTVTIAGGFASVEANTVTVITDCAKT